MIARFAASNSPFGAEVTGVDGTDKLDAMRALGADHVIDYTQEDFTQNGVLYDLIFEVAGKASYSRCIRSLNHNGRLVLANPKFSQMLRAPITSCFDGEKLCGWYEALVDPRNIADMVGRRAASTCS